MNDFLSGLHFTCREVVSRLVFLNDTRKRPLEVLGANQKARYIKLQLAAEEFFHLERIRILVKGENATLDLAPLAEMNVSSVWGDTEWLVTSRAVLTGERKDSRFGFHTKREPQPWIIIKLPEMASIDRILISNRSDDCAYRSLPLIVSISPDQHNWTILYNHAQVLDSLRSALDQSIALRAPEHNERSAMKLALDLLWFWYLGDVPRINRIWVDYARSRHKTDDQRQVIDYFNNNILNEQKKALTIHGIARPFRFWSSDEKRAYIEFANHVMEELRPLSDNVCLGYGSVLGIVRQQDLLPHDEDIDVLIAMPGRGPGSMRKGIDKVQDFLRNRGLEVTGDFAGHRWVASGRHKLDIFVGIIEDEYVSFFPGHRKQIKTDDMFPGLRVRVCGVETGLPRNPFLYLERVYGPDWNIPNTAWQHSWDAAEFRDLL